MSNLYYCERCHQSYLYEAGHDCPAPQPLAYPAVSDIEQAILKATGPGRVFPVDEKPATEFLL